MKKDKNKKENLSSESMQNRFLRAFRQQLRDNEVTKIVVNGVIIRMPLGIILSRMKPTKLQMNIITTIMKVIGKNVANELQKESLGSLFSKAEFGEDENTVNFVIRERDFGIPRKHRKDLYDAVKMMTVFPVEIPEIGKVTGDPYIKHGTLCTIREKETNSNEDKIFIVTMERNVADLLVNRNTEFASLTDISYKEFRSKFSYRFYLFTVSIYSVGKISFSFEYLRKIFSNGVEEHKRYVKFEEDVLSKAQKDLLDIYNKGLLHYWFEYHPTSAERKALKQRGNPEEVIFEFHTHPALPKEEVKVVPSKTIKEIEEKLIKEFGIFPNSAKEFAMQLNVDNISAFDEKVKCVKEKMRTAEKSPNGFAFAAFTNFFKEYGNGFTEVKEIKEEKPSEEESVQDKEKETAETVTEISNSINDMRPTSIDYRQLLDGCAAITVDLSFLKSPERTIDFVDKGDEFWRHQWYACRDLMEKFGYDIAYILSHMLTMESYDCKKKILTLNVPGPTRDVEEFIERNFRETFRNHIIQFFPLDVCIEYSVVKFVTNEDVEWKKKLHETLDKKKKSDTLFHPRDENGMTIEEEKWKWNLCSLILAQYVSEQDFNESFAKLRLDSCSKDLDPRSLTLLFDVEDMNAIDKIEDVYANLFKRVLNFVYNKKIIVQYRKPNQ